MFKVKLQIDASELATELADNIYNSLELDEELGHITLSDSDRLWINNTIFTQLESYFRNTNGEILD